MKLILVNLVAVLLLGACSSGTKLKSNDKETANHGDKTKQFTDLNDDVLYLIMENLELEDLISTIEAIPSFSDILEVVVRRKYLGYDLKIYLWYGQNRFYLNKVEKYIQIYDLQPILTTLKLFGNNFQSITLDYTTVSSVDLRIIVETIYKYCSKSMKSLVLKDVTEHLLNQLVQPLEVEELNCTIHFASWYQKQIPDNSFKPWNQVFPKLQRLNLELKHILDFIDCEFPKLEHLGLNTERFNGNNTDVVESMIQKNPQIKSVTLGRFQPFGKFIASQLQNLEILRIGSLGFLNESITFENVKNFVVNRCDIQNINYLTFPQLESLKLLYFTDQINEILPFFKRHLHVNHLDLSLHTDFRTIPLVDMTVDFPNLIDVTIRRNNYLGTNNITEFIEQHEKLQRFRFTTLRGSFTEDVKVESFLEKFGNEWEIRHEVLGVVFEKNKYSQQRIKF